MLPDQPQGNISREMANLASLIPNDYKSIDVLKMLAFFPEVAVPWNSYNND